MTLLVNPYTSASMSCKPDSNQQCKDYISKLAQKYELQNTEIQKLLKYRNSPFANDCKNKDPNYKVSQDLATTCEDGYF